MVGILRGNLHGNLRVILRGILRGRDHLGGGLRGGLVGSLGGNKSFEPTKLCLILNDSNNCAFRMFIYCFFVVAFL